MCSHKLVWPSRRGFCKTLVSNSPRLQKCARFAHMAVPECSLDDTFSSALGPCSTSLRPPNRGEAKVCKANPAKNMLAYFLVSRSHGRHSRQSIRFFSPLRNEPKTRGSYGDCPSSHAHSRSTGTCRMRCCYCPQLNSRSPR